MDRQEVVDLVIMAVYRDRKALARSTDWPGLQREYALVDGNTFTSLGMAARPENELAIQPSASGDLKVLGIPVRLDPTLGPGTIKLVGPGDAVAIVGLT